LTAIGSGWNWLLWREPRNDEVVHGNAPVPFGQSNGALRLEYRPTAYVDFGQWPFDVSLQNESLPDLSILKYPAMNMRSIVRLPIIASFLFGVLSSGALVTIVLLSYERQQSQIVWVGLLQKDMRTLNRVHREGNDFLADEIARDLPRLARSVASFGFNEATIPVLKSVKSYSRDTGTPLPDDLQRLLSPL
jgi:hypothetical protein